MHTAGLLNALEAARTWGVGRFAVASSLGADIGQPVTNGEFAPALEETIPGLRLDLLPGREHGPGEDPYLDVTRLTADTGFEPAFDARQAVADYVAWRRENPR